MRLFLEQQILNDDVQELDWLHFQHLNVIKQDSPQVCSVVGAHMCLHKVFYKVLNRCLIE
jgi:hypothetical protein